MSNVIWNFLVCLTLTLAYRQNIPLGIVVDSGEEEVVATLRRLIDIYNNINGGDSSKIIITPTWAIADMSSNCNLIKVICRCLDAGVFLFLGSSSSRTYNIIQSYSQALHVPYVLYTQTTNHNRGGHSYDIGLSPNYMTAIIDVIKFFKWRKIYYVFDSDDALWELQRIYDAFRVPGYDLIVDTRRVKNVSSAHEFLRTLDRFSTRSGNKRIVLNLSSRTAYRSLLDQIVDVGMNRHNYHYLLSGPYIDSLDLHSFLYGGVNMTGFRLAVNKMSPGKMESTFAQTLTRISTDAALASDGLKLIHQAVSDLLKPPSSRNVLRTLTSSSLYGNGSREVKCWTQPPVPWSYGSRIRESLLKTVVSGFTGPLALDATGVRVGYQLDLMHLEYRTPLRKVGTWTRKGGVLTSLPHPPPEKLSLDANRTRVVITILENPFVMLRCPKDGTPCNGNDRFEGYSVDLLRLLAAKIKFDYVIELVADNSYGARQADGSWNGLMGDLLSGKADMVIAPMTITEIRERYVDFSKPFMQLGTSIMIKKPEKEKGGVFSFKNPLSNGVWLAIIGCFIGVSIVLFFVGRFSPYEWASGGTRPSHKAKPAFSVANTVWFTLGALMQQGSDIYPKSISGRIVGTAWWFFTLIIISSYTANLAAFLTIERMEIPINSADDLIKQSEIQFGIIANGSTEEFFKNSNVTVYSKMWNIMKDAQPSVFVKTTEEGVNRVRQSKRKYAFLLDSSFNDYHNQRKPCNTMKVGRDLDVKGYGIATPRNSDLKAAINIGVLELNEIGDLLKLYQKWWYDKGQCAADSGKETTTSALTLSNVSGIFHILIAGLILAMITALIDFLVKRKLRHRKKIKVVLKTSTSQQEVDVLSYHRRRQRASDENGDCHYGTLESSLSRMTDRQGHQPLDDHL